MAWRNAAPLDRSFGAEYYFSVPNDTGLMLLHDHNSAGAWAKRYHLASRVALERILRPHDLGPTQWYVLEYLTLHGPTPQREFTKLLHIEKPGLSDVVSALTRKGFIYQSPDPKDQRQRILEITAAGQELWKKLPDPIEFILQVAFEGVPKDTLEMVADVLKTATERLKHHIIEGTGP